MLVVGRADMPLTLLVGAASLPRRLILDNRDKDVPPTNIWVFPAIHGV